MLPQSQQHGDSIPDQEPAALNNVTHAYIPRVHVFALCALALSP